MRIQKFESIDQIDRLGKIVFLNFIELQTVKNIEFSINIINEILSSENLLGWFFLDSDDKIQGYCIGLKKTLEDGRYVYQIHYFYLIEKIRSFGLAFQLMIRIMKFIQDSNIQFLMQIVNVKSNQFILCQRLGFQSDPLIKILNPSYTMMMCFM